MTDDELPSRIVNILRRAKARGTESVIPDIDGPDRRDAYEAQGKLVASMGPDEPRLVRAAHFRRVGPSVVRRPAGSDPATAARSGGLNDAPDEQRPAG